MDIRIVDVEWALDDAGATYPAYVVELARGLQLCAHVRRRLRNLRRRGVGGARRVGRSRGDGRRQQRHAHGDGGRAGRDRR